MVNKLDTVKHLLEDPSFWVLVAFIIFSIVVFKFAKDKIIAFLDTRIDRIKNEINESEEILAKANKVIEESASKKHNAPSEANAIIEEGKQNAIALKKSSLDYLNEETKRKEENFVEKIQTLKNEAIDEFKNNVINLSIASTIRLLNSSLKDADSKNILDNAINDIGKKFN